MVGKTFLEELKQTTKASKAEQKRKGIEARRKFEEEKIKRLTKAVQPQYDKIVATLEEDIRKAAKKGESEISLISNHWGYFSDEQSRLMSMLTSWAWEHGLHTDHSSSAAFGSDGDPSEYFAISWR